MMETLVLRVKVPAVLSFLRPVWRSEAIDLSVEFYNYLFGESYTLPQALLKARKRIMEDYERARRSHEHYCPFAWAVPVLVWQQEQPKPESPGEDPMIDSNVMVSQLASIVAMLSSFVVPGGKGFVEGVGKGLGERFAQLAWEAIEKTKSLQQATPLGAQPSMPRPINSDLIKQTLRQNHNLTEEMHTQVVPAFQRLLRESDYFTFEDLANYIVPDMGYTLEKLAGPNPTHALLANKLVAQTWADGKFESLLQQIKERKKWLYAQTG